MFRTSLQLCIRLWVLSAWLITRMKYSFIIHSLSQISISVLKPSQVSGTESVKTLVLKRALWNVSEDVIKQFNGLFRIISAVITVSLADCLCLSITIHKTHVICLLQASCFVSTRCKFWAKENEETMTNLHYSILLSCQTFVYKSQQERGYWDEWFSYMTICFS